MRSLLALTLLVVSLLACSRANEPDPTPIPAQLRRVTTLTGDFAPTYLLVDSLVPNPGQPFTLRFGQPIHGTLELQGGRLVYSANIQAGWTLDSAWYRITQNGQTGTGTLLFVNPIQPTACQEQPVIFKTVASLATFQQRLVTAGQAGRITQYSAQNYQVDTLAGSQILEYTAAGNPVNYGYDTLRYNWSEGANCYQGYILVEVGNPCGPKARRFVVPSGTTFIAKADLLATFGNSCTSQQAQGEIHLGATTAPAQVPTRQGNIAEATVSGLEGFRYTRSSGTAADSVQLFFIDATDERITTAHLVFTP